MNINNHTFRIWRRQNNLTQRDVAKMIGVRWETVSNWERKGFPETRNQPAVEMAKGLVSGDIKIEH